MKSIRDIVDENMPPQASTPLDMGAYADAITKAMEQHFAKQQKINNEVLADKCDELDKMAKRHEQYVLKARIESVEKCLDLWCHDYQQPGIDLFLEELKRGIGDPVP